MLKALSEVLPSEAERLDKCGADNLTIKRYIYTHNYQIRGKFDPKVLSGDGAKRKREEIIEESMNKKAYTEEMKR